MEENAPSGYDSSEANSVGAIPMRHI
jgi:hypothetical protein